MMEGQTPAPSVTVVLVNYNGVEHLPACLDSLARLDYPRDRHEVVVVDNGSTDGSLDLLAERYPGVRVLAQERNLGFAGGNNVAAEASSADCLALLNTDMAVEPDWLTELVRSYAPDEGYRCVAGVILDWSGERLDFADGVVTYYGMADQLDFGKPVDEVAIPESRDLLFACGGSMLVDRETYLAIGGLDPEYFAYFEDVDFGWRLWLAGHRVRLASRARSRHRHHGTSGGLPWHQRRLLYERNALRTLVKNLDEPNLWPLLSAALLVLSERARVLMGTRREEYELVSGAADEEETVRRDGVAVMHGVGDLVQGLEELMARRAEVQALRRRGDGEIFELFRRPFLPLGPAETSFVEAVAAVTRALGLEERFARRRAAHLVVVADEPAARCRELAGALARHIRVTLASAVPVELEAPCLTVASFGSDEELARLALEADVVLAPGLAVVRHPVLATVPAVRIVDLPPHELSGEEVRELLDAGELFVCATEDERELWLERLGAHGRLDGDARRADPTLRRLIDVVPSDAPDAIGPIVAVCEEPWRWTSRRGPRRRAGAPTEDVQVLLGRRRVAPPEPVAEPRLAPVTSAARGVWTRLPERLRVPLRSARRRVQARRARA
jgi:GT2 family glycosyltransferase